MTARLGKQMLQSLFGMDNAREGETFSKRPKVEEHKWEFTENEIRAILFRLSVRDIEQLKEEITDVDIIAGNHFFWDAYTQFNLAVGKLEERLKLNLFDPNADAYADQIVRTYLRKKDADAEYKVDETGEILQLLLHHFARFLKDAPGRGVDKSWHDPKKFEKAARALLLMFRDAPTVVQEKLLMDHSSQFLEFSDFDQRSLYDLPVLRQMYFDANATEPVRWHLQESLRFEKDGAKQPNVVLRHITSLDYGDSTFHLNERNQLRRESRDE